MFRSSVVTFDWPGHVLYLQKPDRILPFDRDRAGVRLNLVGDGLNVAYVSPDGPAAKAGLKAGDRIVAIDGRRIDSSYYEHADWSHEPAGTAVTLERADGSIVKVELANFY